MPFYELLSKDGAIKKGRMLKVIRSGKRLNAIPVNSVVTLVWWYRCYVVVCYCVDLYTLLIY